MWANTFESRLTDWNRLRQGIQSIDSESLLIINDWWFRAPMITHNLHWADVHEWPDPWDLLADDKWCDLARGLGMLYTILMIDDTVRKNVQLIGTQDYNLVLVDSGKYILNWSPQVILNIHSIHQPILRTVSGEQIYNLIGE